MGKAGLLDRPMGNAIFSITFTREDDLPIRNPYELAREICLTFNGDVCLYPYIVSRKRLKITLFSQRSVRTWRRNFKGIWTVNGIGRVDKSADRLAHAGTVFHGDALLAVDIVANQEPSPPAIDLDLDKG
jgi:hypothetical protein